MNDEKFMRLAIKEAKSSEGKHKTAYGVVIVKNNEVISSACNIAKKTNDPTAHAEIIAIRKACEKLNSRDLSSCVVYSTCEPCPMCFSALFWAKISKIVYGISISDLINLNRRQINVSCDFLNKNSNSKIEIVGGFLKEECFELFK
ncbi:nucleoside deaminase [Candidatus Woesearchaeota archaeon]|nr:nucleoside deaminase [Candidatus Woesearchaeota archaeon]MBT6520099.1 nucleoside deaminase [Candidatus Woesearchaeota archaeon]MBT7366704.1 nucleoside deaminase [Candidatus Woesearchaeota archaeon]